MLLLPTINRMGANFCMFFTPYAIEKKRNNIQDFALTLHPERKGSDRAKVVLGDKLLAPIGVNKRT